MIGGALPDPSGLKPFYYLVFFVLGYLVVCDPAFMRQRRALPPAGAGARLRRSPCGGC